MQSISSPYIGFLEMHPMCIRISSTPSNLISVHQFQPLFCRSRCGMCTQVGAVALSKLAAAAGPALSSVPLLPTHLLQRYLALSLQLQRHRLHSNSVPPGQSVPNVVPFFSTGGNSGSPGAGDAASGDVGMDNGSVNWAGPRVGVGVGVVGQRFPSSTSDAPPPPFLHASSLRLFLGCLCRMLGEDQGKQQYGPSSSAGSSGSPGSSCSSPGNGAQNVPSQQQQQQQGVGGVIGGGTSEVEDVLRRLVEGEVGCLRGVLDRRREIGERRLDCHFYFLLASCFLLCVCLVFFVVSVILMGFAHSPWEPKGRFGYGRGASDSPPKLCFFFVVTAGRSSAVVVTLEASTAVSKSLIRISP